MRILSFDTSQPVGSVALAHDGSAAASASFGASSTHLVGLGDAVRSLLRSSGIAISDIERVAFVSGPGSFTGLRVGLSYVKGLYAALQPDLVTMTSLELLARQAMPQPERVCAMIDARRDEVYTAVYHRTGPEGTDLRRVIEARAVAPGACVAALDVTPTIFIGSGAVRYRSLVEDAFGADAVFVDEEANSPSTSHLCRYAEALTPLSADEILVLEPYYIRPSDAKLKPLREIRTRDEG